ncbi:MAG: hypothetical protein ABSB97_04395 [Thermoplasmata archaeon]|jgi:hypothetical protein
MSPQTAYALPTVDPTALSRLKELARRDWPESHPFRLEVEAISPSDSRVTILERLPTLVRLSRRART